VKIADYSFLDKLLHWIVLEFKAAKILSFEFARLFFFLHSNSSVKEKKCFCRKPGLHLRFGSVGHNNVA